MKYDPNAMNYVFSTEQEITAEEKSQLRQQLLANAFKPIAGDRSSLMKSITAAAIFTVFLVAIIAAASTGHVWIAAFIFGLMFFIGGVVMLISGT
jgi:predicted phage tail protein